MSRFRLDDELVGLHGEEAAARAMVEIGMAPDEAKALAHKRATTIPVWEPFHECDTSNPPPEVHSAQEAGERAMSQIDVEAVLRTVDERQTRTPISPLGASARRMALASLCRRGHLEPLLQALGPYRVPSPSPDDPIEAAIAAAQQAVKSS